MELVPRAFPLEEERKLKRLAFLRIIMSTLVIGAAIMILQLNSRLISVAGLYSLLGIVYICTGSAYLAYKKGVSVDIVIRVLIGIDICVLSMLTYYSGGASSYFTMLFILPILVGGEFFQVSGGLITAILAASVYFTFSMLEISGKIVSPAGSWMQPYSRTIFSNLIVQGYLYSVIFVLTGLVSGYASKYLHKKAMELEDKENEIRQIRFDTDSILMNMSSGLVVADLDGMILTINNAAVEILGMKSAIDYKGKNVKKVFSNMPHLVHEFIITIDSGLHRKRYEIEVQRTDGSVVPLGISTSTLKDEGGEIKGVIAIFQDLTEVDQMREKIRQSDKLAAVGELSAAIAHEVRAPLASICGSIEMLKGELDVSGDNEELMDLIITESDRLDRIITDFLEYARMRKPEMTRTDIVKSIRDIVLLLKHSPNLSHKVLIDVNDNISDEVVYIDDEQIRQVFLNIGLNACEMLDSIGTLKIKVFKVTTRLRENRDPEECVRIDFHNDGPVIPEDVLPNIFVPFFTTKNGGTGLGLATAARIVESHSGLIKVESRENTGTVFSVILPVSVPETIKEEENHETEKLCSVDVI
ncbi:MAG: PAS domain S-box protein [Candidatus Krumholzibacteriota bacterium]|nr:PAS domain S-box protein [Candidatus Krumholzibacteriota bacterium]